MQITSGLVTLTNGSSLVQGNASVDWTQVEPNSLFIVNGKVFTINTVDAGAKQLQISPSWTDATVADIAYVVARDFTPNAGLPLLNAGDLEAAALFSRAMRILDTISSASGDPAVSDIVITKTGHQFIVGNVLTLTGGTWKLATSDTVSNAMAVGFVSKVVDANVFWLRTSGRVGDVVGSPIQGITLAAGTIYYLRLAGTTVSVEISAGVFANRQVNICTGLLADAGEMLVPVLQADASTSGYIIGMASAQTNVFGANKPGLVPDPGASLTGRVLLDTGWATFATGLNTIRAKHLDPATITEPATELEWSNFESRTGETPVFAYILDLQTRLKTMEDNSAIEPYNKRVITRKEFTSGDWSWSIPGGTKHLALTLISGDASVKYQANLSPTKGLGPYGYLLGNTMLKVLINVEGASTISGRIEDVTRGGQVYENQPLAGKIVVKLDSTTVITLRSTIVQVQSNGSLIVKALRPEYTISLPQVRPGTPPYWHVLSSVPYDFSQPLMSYHFDTVVDLSSEPESAYLSHYRGFWAADLLTGVVVIERGRIAI